MAKCSQQLSTDQAARLTDNLIVSKFSNELYKYYQGLSHTWPDVGDLVGEINDKRIPPYFRDSFTARDRVDFLNDPVNTGRLVGAIGEMLSINAQANPQDLPSPPYVSRQGVIMDLLRSDADERLNAEVKDIQEVEDKENIIDSPTEDIVSTNENNYPAFKRKYDNLGAYRRLRFMGSATTETLTIGKFVNDVLIRNAFIDTDKKSVVDQVQYAGEPGEIDQNLKAYRKDMFTNLVTRLNLQDVVDGKSVPLAVDDHLNPEKFDKVLHKIEQSVMNVKYKGESVNLADEGVLVEIANELKKSGSPELKKVVDDYIDYVILSDFDKLFSYYTNDAIHVNDGNSNFDISSRKYSLEKVNSLDALNVNWTEKVHNGVELASNFYKTLVEYTPLLSFTTGEAVNDFLYPTLVSEVLSPYYDHIDRQKGARDIKDVIIRALGDRNLGQDQKNTLYTLYKRFFEEAGDKLTLHKKNKNTEVSSFLDTLSNDPSHPLMLAVIKPIHEIAKVFYAEAAEENKIATIRTIESKVNSATRTNVRNELVTNVNKTPEEITKLVAKYNIKFVNGRDSKIMYSTNPGQIYELKPTGAKAYDMSVITDLSKDLLGVDFVDNNSHKEFLAELQSRAGDNESISNQYLTFLHDALRVLEARQILADPKWSKLIEDSGADASTPSEIVNKAVKLNGFNYNEPLSNLLPLGTNAEGIYDILASAENRYAGNRVQHTRTTLEGTTVASFSTYTYFNGLKQNLAKARRVLGSVKGVDDSRAPLAENIFVKDPSLMKSLPLKSATKIGTIVKGNAEMSDLETLHFNINLGYFDNIAKAQRNNTDVVAMFDPTTYSDKTSNYMVAVNNMHLGKPLFVQDGKAVHEDVTRKLHFDSIGAYYRAHANNVFDTWRSVFSAVSNSNPESKALELFDQYVQAKMPASKKMEAINFLLEGDKQTKGFFRDPNNFSNDDHGLTGLAAARFYASKAGVSLTNWIHYINNGKSIDNDNVLLGTKPVMVKYMSLFDNTSRKEYDAFMNKKMVESAQEMHNLGFLFDNVASKSISQLYPNLQAGFLNAGGMNLFRNGKVSNSVSDIHPAFRKYFNDFNLVSENLMNSALGSPFAHKGDSAFKSWVTQVKRNVAATASIRNYTLGLERGVENFTNSAIIDDFETKLKTILGDVQDVVDMDGASLETMTQRVKTWVSLNSEFGGNGGMDHKSFFSDYDPNTGIMRQKKHAAFAMDYDMIRDSQGSEVDLMELHKKLYSTNLSKIDVTRSWKDSVNLAYPKDVYYWDRKFDFDNNLAGSIWKLESIVHTGKDLFGDSTYTITKRNLTTDSVQEVPMVHINTMFELWNVLGGIDSVEPTDDRTSISYHNGTAHQYFKKSHTSAERLVDHESYMGDKQEYMVPADYILAKNTSDINAWNIYNKLFDSDGVVNSHIALIRKYMDQDATSGDVQIALQQELHGVDSKVNSSSFITTIQENKALLENFFAKLIDPTVKDRIGFGQQEVKYQRYKGKNIDRLSFAGAVKVGQVNMNDTATISRNKLAELEATNPKIQGKEIPGIHTLVTYPISNFNGGIQLNAWHEAEDSTVTAPTQMLNALSFNGKNIQDVTDVYRAIGDLVDAELTKTLANPEVGGERKANIPQLVDGLSNAEFYDKNRDTLLRVFHSLMEEKVAKKDDFTLQGLIVETFNHSNLPIDDAHMFSSAVAELSNYFTKNGIRINFDGIFSVLKPSSRMMQFHDVIGGFLPVKSENGALTYNALDETVPTTLTLSDYKAWKSYNDWLISNPGRELEDPTDDDFVIEHKPGRELTTQPRDLKGQQVVLRYADGTTTPLSILRDSEEHLIPEAKALTTVNGLIDTYSKQIAPRGEALLEYKKYSPEEHAEYLADNWQAFKLSLGDMLTPGSSSYDPHVAHTFSDFAQRMEAIDPKLLQGDFFDNLYVTFNANKSFRDNLNAKYESEKDYKNLRLSREYEYLDKLEQVNKLFTSSLQKFLDDATHGDIPTSLKQPHLFDPNLLKDGKITVSRGECLAPLTAKRSFLLREGDNLNDVNEHLFYKRLDDQLDYLKVNADSVLISKNGRKVFTHNGSPKGLTPSANLRVIDGTTWYTTSTGNQLFEVPRGVFITNIGGEIHAYLRGKFKASDPNNPLTRSLSAAFRDQSENFKNVLLGDTPAEKEQIRQEVRKENLKKAQAMWSSWQKYLEVIGTRIPGQHFQSFQGMKIVGFTEGNAAMVPNEVTLLSGSDFDIDKQNLIYHSLNDNGTLAFWHPASRYDTIEHINKSLELPLQKKRKDSDFTPRKDSLGNNIEPTMTHDDNSDLRDLNVLLGIYKNLENGFKVDADTHPRTLEALVQYDNHVRDRVVLDDEDAESVSEDILAQDQYGLNGGVKGIKNFAISRTNKTIENPANFIYESKPVSFGKVALFASNSSKGEQALKADPHKPNSITNQKEANMVGKKVIGIMATGLKAWSAISVTYNNEMIKNSTLINELTRLNQELSKYSGDPITNKANIDKLTTDIIATQTKINRSFNAIRLDKLPISDMLRDDLGKPMDLIPNLNYNNISSEALTSFFKHIGRDTDLSASSPLAFKEYVKTRASFEDDAAEILSQLLSAATDNAKELILAKINASPDLAGMYASMIMMGVPFEQIVTKMTSPAMEMLIKKGSTNVFDSKTTNRSINKLMSNMINYYDASMTSDRKNAIAKDLSDNYGLNTAVGTKTVDGQKVKSEMFVDKVTKEQYDVDELKTLKVISDASNEVALLGRMLSINQGVKSNSWDLHRYRMQIEDYVNKLLGDKSFSFKEFLDSVNSGGSYHETMIDALSQKRSAFNILHILASNPHFAKQLTAYNAAATILGLSSYKINSADRIVEKLRDMNFLSANQDVTKEQYADVERFIENTVIENFIASENQNNDDPHSRPVFYDGDQMMTITTPEGQQEFATWVKDVFLPRIKEQQNLRGNEFIQGLTTDTKRDALLNDKFSFVKLKLDTTNVKSQVQEGNRDVYTYNLRLLYNRGATDLQHESPEKQNDIVNTLFWYNLIVNKNNITKYSYARLLGDVMGLGETKDNPYRRLLELKGNVGKNHAPADRETSSLLTSNGINFDIFDLLYNYESFISKTMNWSGKERTNEIELGDLNDDGVPMIEDDDVPEVAEAPEQGDPADDYQPVDDVMNNEYDESDISNPNRPRLTVEKYRVIGEPGTFVKIKVGDDVVASKNVVVPGSLIPHGSQNRSKHTFYNEYNPLKSSKDSLNDTDSVNYQKMLNSSVHEFLKNMSTKFEIRIHQAGGPDEGEIFDPKKTYECI